MNKHSSYDGLKRGIYVLNIKEKDGANDKGSHLDRKNTFTRLLGAIPKRPDAGGIVDMDYDFSALNQLLPHPGGIRVHKGKSPIRW